LELLQNQSQQRQLTQQQNAELAERKRNAENELRGGISQLYPVVYTPQYSEQSGQPYVFDPLTVQSYSQAPQLHKRIREALSNRVVWDSAQPSKLVSLTRLNEQQPLERQYYPVSTLVSCFFSYYNWTHIWDEKVVRQAIIVGIKNRTFAYVANARKDEQENLVLSEPAPVRVQFGKDVPAYELDMGEGAFILSATYAQQLLTPPASPEPEIVTIPPTGEMRPGYGASGTHSGETGKTIVRESAPPPLSTLPVPPSAKPVPPGRGGRYYRLIMNIKPGDFFEVSKALEKLNDLVDTMDTTVTVFATAKSGQPFHANTLHNLVVEPMVEESNVIVQEEQVEE
jgi:hypothetical protein